jgi:DNA-binding LytR/AlgR family response regulator
MLAAAPSRLHTLLRIIKADALEGRFTMRDFASSSVEDLLLRAAGRAGLAMLFAAILAFLAPFGTYRFDVIDRVGYWTVQMAGWLILSQSAALLISFLPGMRSRTRAQRLIFATLLATLPMMLVTGVATNMMSGWQPNPGDLIELFLSISLIGGGYTFLSDRLVGGLIDARNVPAPVADEPHSEAAHSEQVPAAVDGPTDIALIERLPAHIRAEILCLQVEDHYVRVHSSKSNAMVLMRLSDALRGIDHIPGSQVHRSWWVADKAVVGLRKTGRTAQLTLSNGALVPVSQPYLARAISTWGGLDATAA